MKELTDDALMFRRFIGDEAGVADVTLNWISADRCGWRSFHAEPRLRNVLETFC